MAQPLSVPPGFDELTVDAQIEYVQSLWDRILVRDQGSVRSPAWHREEVRKALAEHEAHPESGASLEQVRADIEAKLRR